MLTGAKLSLPSLVLSLIGAGITAYLTLEHGSGGSPACVVGHGCQVISSSEYAHIGDLPTASIGLLAYLTLGVLAAMRLFMNPPVEIAVRLRQASAVIAFIGTAFSAFLMYIAFFDLEATCLWCIASAVTMTLILAVTILEMRIPDDDEDFSSSV